MSDQTATYQQAMVAKGQAALLRAADLISQNRDGIETAARLEADPHQALTIDPATGKAVSLSPLPGTDQRLARAALVFLTEVQNALRERTGHDDP